MTPEESLTLRSSPGTPVYRFHRIRFADDAPMALEYATVLASCLPSLEAVESSLYEALERAGNRPVRALQRLRAVLFTAEQAELLQAQEKRRRACWSSGSASCKDGRAVEFTQSYYRGDTYDFVAELSIVHRDQRRGEHPYVRARRRRRRRRCASSCAANARARRAPGAAAARRSRRAPWSPARAAAPTTPRPSPST